MSGEKTEAPSQRRLEKAREEGQAAISREMSMLVSLSAGIAVVSWQLDPRSVANWMGAALEQTRYQGAGTFAWAAHGFLWAMLPPSVACVAGYAAATLLQSGLLFHGSALQPDLSRISPMAGLRRILGPQTLVQLLKSLVKLSLLGGCLFVALRRSLPWLPSGPGQSFYALLQEIVAQGRGLILLLLGAQALVAAADYAWERFRHMGRLRMSLQELKDEHKESEGNPQIKARLRQLARSRASKRMLLAVPKAAVVITNPTHYAVALAYERGTKGAPRLVAKGADEVAARIRDLARENRVPIVANPPLARALFRIEIDTEIPAEHFRAVAEVIAFVWRMRGRARM